MDGGLELIKHLGALPSRPILSCELLQSMGIGTVSRLDSDAKKCMYVDTSPFRAVYVCIYMV
jgi:hypothetical protein